MKTYNEMISLPTFEQRFEYLKLHGQVGSDTFGFDRYLNQVFYHSPEWRSVRREVIIRDNGCDLACPDLEIFGRIYIHHMNPIQPNEIEDRKDDILNPNYLVCVSHDTHNAIHYGDSLYLQRRVYTERTRNDTCPWRK